MHKPHNYRKLQLRAAKALIYRSVVLNGDKVSDYTYHTILENAKSLMKSTSGPACYILAKQLKLKV